ncbi:MAG: tRNA (adenosine(37)-N6)-dimethylallyltransferase MiaA [Patescibacteria group bacterium]
MNGNQKLLVVCGPTATGKTSLGIRLAKQFNGEIVSADSRQVYVGMDIGTGKDLPANAKLKIKNGQILKPYRFDEIPVWMLDVVTPAQEFSVADYVNLAWKVISDIWKRKKLPIVVGGTGFYIKGVVNGIETLGVPPDWELRKKLKYEDIKILSEKLKKLDVERWNRMNESDRRNPRRLIRAIEIAQSRGLYHCTRTIVQKREVLFVGLTTSYRVLYQRIDKRVEERIKMGVEDEIKKLLGMGYSFDNSVLGTTIGYKEWKDYIEHKTLNPEEEKEKIIQRWKYNEHNYARRQMTWFRRDSRIHWYDITKRDYKEEIELLVKQWYNPNVSE